METEKLLQYVAITAIGVLFSLLSWNAISLFDKVESLRAEIVEVKTEQGRRTTRLASLESAVAVINISKEERAIKIALLENALQRTERRLDAICQKLRACQ